MKTLVLAAFATAAPALALGLASAASAEQTLGNAASNFSLTDANGKSVSLADYRGKTVILEWNNPGCPFVQKHYNSGNMQKTQASARASGAVWLTINSGAPGKQGYLTAPDAKAFVQKEKASPSHYLLDPKGTVGKLYAAKTTPHLYIINGSGKLVYQGAIDDKPSANAADIPGARNYVLAALSDIKAGKAIAAPESRPYGCSVKYAD